MTLEEDLGHLQSREVPVAAVFDQLLSGQCPTEPDGLPSMSKKPGFDFGREPAIWIGAKLRYQDGQLFSGHIVNRNPPSKPIADGRDEGTEGNDDRGEGRDGG